MVGTEVPDVNGSTLVPHDEGGLVRVETHTRHRGIDLEQTLTLLGAAPAEERRPSSVTLCIQRDASLNVIMSPFTMGNNHGHLSNKTNIFWTPS